MLHLLSALLLVYVSCTLRFAFLEVGEFRFPAHERHCMRHFAFWLWAYYGRLFIYCTRLVGLVLQPEVWSHSQKVLWVRHSFFVQRSSLNKITSNEAKIISWVQLVMSPLRLFTKNPKKWVKCVFRGDTANKNSIAFKKERSRSLFDLDLPLRTSDSPENAFRDSKRGNGHIPKNGRHFWGGY